jgi:phosphoglucosamine mutase
VSAAAEGIRLFGTDGVRGPANTVLTPEMVLSLARAGAFVLTGGAPAQQLVMGRDTRVSGQMLAAAAGAGVMSAGVDLVDLGVFPTAGVAFLTRVLPAAAGLVISASHNPFDDNGIKFFARDGSKLDEESEDEIERYHLAAPQRVPRPEGRGVGRLLPAGEARDAYVRHIVATATTRFDGLRVLVDSANGATAGFAREVLERLGASVTEMSATPDGFNINAGCGSTHPERAAAATAAGLFDAGLALDGDGDRLIAVDRRGRLVDGDDILAICALDLLARNMLPHGAVAATVMSNLALDAALRSAGGRVVRTGVGDRQVYVAMRNEGLSLGGEQSGHIIFLDHHTTGDGLITAVQLLNVLVRRGRSLDEVPGRLDKYPQINRSVHAPDRSCLGAVAENPAVAEAVARARDRLGQDGRVVLRPSGTEPIIRIMVEAAGRGEAERLASELASVVGRVARGVEAGPKGAPGGGGNGPTKSI